MRTFFLMLASLAACSVGHSDVLTGVVLQENGSPAAGATITAAAVFKSPPMRLMTKADDKGAFHIDLPKLSGSNRFVLAVRWKLQGANFRETLDENGKMTDLQGQALPPVSIRLRTEGELKGRLLQAEDDEPIRCARVYLDTGEVLTTDDRGEFRVSGLPMKRHSLIPVAAGRSRPYVNFETTKRPNAELELRLPRGVIIKGKITDEQGKAISGAYLTRSASGTALTLNGWDEVCQPDGSFEFGWVSSKLLFDGLQAHAPGYVAQEIFAEVNVPPQPLVRNVQLKKTATPELKKPPRMTVSGLLHNGLQSVGAFGGTVTNWSGNTPVRNFNIRSTIPRERHPKDQFAGGGRSGIWFTRGDGTFVFTSEGTDRWTRLIVSSPGVGFEILGRVKSEALDQLSPLDTTIVKLQPFVPLSVQVLDAETGKPLQHALVTLLEDKLDFPHGFDWGHDDLWGTHKRCDEMGKAVFAEPACKDGTVIVRAAGFARSIIAWTDGSEKMTVELEPAAILRGEVHLGNRPAKDGYIRLQYENNAYYVDLAKENGRFEFGHLSAGEYELTVNDWNNQELYLEKLTLNRKEKKSLRIKIIGSPPR